MRSATDGALALRYASLAYLAGLTIHTADHFRRGVDAVTPEVLWLGTVGTVVALAAIGAILAGHPRGPLLAVLAGFSQAVGVILVHFGPSLGAFSDPLLGGGATGGTVSVFAATVEVAGALAAGFAGAYALRRGGATTSAA